MSVSSVKNVTNALLRAVDGVVMTDQLLIQHILAGDTEAYAVLVARHHERCARIAYRILGNREDAEEAIQDAFVRAYRSLGSYEDRERFASWLARILVNQCRTMSQRARRRDALFIDAGASQVERTHAAAPDGDRWPALEDALAQLPRAQREAIVLRYADDLTYDEMARITGTGASALKMRVQRAFTRLRSLLQEVPHDGR